MGVRRSCLVLGVLLVAEAALAGDHNIDFSAGGSGGGESGSLRKAFGGYGAVGFTFGDSHKWSVVLDASVHRKWEDDDLKQWSGLGGLRRTRHNPERRRRFLPYGQVLIGVLDRDGNINVNSGSAIVAAPGVGADFAVDKDKKDWALRVQFDVVMPLSRGVNWGPRLSVGVVHRRVNPLAEPH